MVELGNGLSRLSRYEVDECQCPDQIRLVVVCAQPFRQQLSASDLAVPGKRVELPVQVQMNAGYSQGCPSSARRRSKSPSRFAIATPGRRKVTAPSGSPQTARSCCSN